MVSKYRYIKWHILSRKSGSSSDPCVQAAELGFYNSNNVSFVWPNNVSITSTVIPDSHYATEEAISKLIDGNVSTKWCGYSGGFTTAAVDITNIIDLGPGNTIDLKIYNRYYYYTANDIELRDPTSWTIEVSNDGTNWIMASIQNGVSITSSRNALAGIWDIFLTNNIYTIDQAASAKLTTGDIINCDYSGSSKQLKLPKGEYKLECWGAQGGTYSSYIGGKGGYSVGILKLNEEKNLYIYSGGAGSSSTITAGFNGGGQGISSGRGGGGASDIRIGQDSLYARVIVAGGGGGAGVTSANTNPAGCGGGIYGGDGYYNYTDGSTNQKTGSNRAGGGGGPTYAGITWSTGASASFGSGSNASGYSCGGGGGGWYGGAGAYDNDSDSDGRWGGGGSGYVYTSSTASNYPSGCLLDSSMYLTNASTIAGNISFTSPIGDSETGHSGNGYVRITIIECKSEYTSIGGHSSDSSNKVEITPGDIINYDYTGTVQKLELPKGQYKLECWGAEGTVGGGGGTTGKGGYSVGTLTLTKTETVYIYTGGKGTSGTTSATAGFNGGGRGYSSNGRTMGSGGGGSDIRLGQDSLYARVIVAGGGGGGNDSGSSQYGGHAGGTQGLRGTDLSATVTGGNVYGGGGSQTAGGNARTTTSWDSSYINGILKGSFGQGGGAVTTSMQYINGAGGGWYGGGAGGPDGGAGGGSGYVYTFSTASNYPSGCLLDSSMYLTDASTVAGNTSFTSPTGSSETGHTGNGYVRITVIDCDTTPPTHSSSNSFWFKINNEWQKLNTGIDGNNNNNESGYVKKSGDTMTGKLKLSDQGVEYPDASGYYTDQYGNFHSKSAENTAYWNLTNNAGTATFKLYWNTGNMNINGTLSSNSDERLKNSIKPLPDSVDNLLLELPSKSFKYNINPNNKNNYGFIAQDVQQLMDKYHLQSDLVKQNEDGYLSLTYQDFIPMLIHLCQTQQKEIDELKEKIESLE